VNLLSDLSLATAEDVARRIVDLRRPGDIVVVSIHWGSNWGYRVDHEPRAFAHALIDAGACDLVHGHSSHHARGLEIYRDRLILYGCGDFITDYEGIEGYEQYRGDLSIAYLPQFDAKGALSELALMPYQMRRFRLQRASQADAAWLQATLDRESARFGTHVTLKNGRLIAARAEVRR
jgi:poly-gamma-glutamate synthesis protein (capsule biosynthesis protein)